MPKIKLSPLTNYRMVANAFRVRPTTHIDFGDGQPLAQVQFMVGLQPDDGTPLIEVVGPNATKKKELERLEAFVWMGQALLARTLFTGLPEDPAVWAAPQHGPKARWVDVVTRTTLNQLLVREREPFYNLLEKACGEFADRWRPADTFREVGHPFVSGSVNWRIGVFDNINLDDATQITPDTNAWCYPTAETGFEFAEREARAALSSKKRGGYNKGHVFHLRGLLFDGSTIVKRNSKEFVL